MLTNFEKLEWWLANAQPGAELIFFDDPDNLNLDLNRAANRNAAFAHVWETLKREEGNKHVYLAIDMMGRAVATKL